MDQKIDFSFYNQVRDRFSSFEKEMIILVSLSSSRVEDLMGQIFIEASEFNEYYQLMLEHLDNDWPYAVLSWTDEEPGFFFRCKEFVKKENLKTGKTLRFRLDPFRKIDFSSAAVKAEFAQLAKLLCGNSEAS